jgi:hypothetical protein
MDGGRRRARQEPIRSESSEYFPVPSMQQRMLHPSFDMQLQMPPVVGHGPYNKDEARVDVEHSP